MASQRDVSPARRLWRQCAMRWRVMRSSVAAFAGALWRGAQPLVRRITHGIRTHRKVVFIFSVLVVGLASLAVLLFAGISGLKLVFSVLGVGSLASLAMLLLAGISGMADLGPALDKLYRRQVLRAFPAARSDEILIMVVRFETTLPGAAPHAEIAHAIQKAACELGDGGIRVEKVRFTDLSDAGDDHHATESLGSFYKASVVIWGNQSDVRTTVKFLNLRQPESPWSKFTLPDTEHSYAYVYSEPERYTQFVIRDLPGCMTFLALYAVAGSYRQQADYARVIQALDRALASATNTDLIPPGALADVHLVRGLARAKQGDLAGAFADFDKAIRLWPDLAEAYNNRGLARTKQGKLADAIADFDEAIRLRPDYAEAYNNRGVARTKQGDPAGAIADFAKAEAIRRPDYAEAYNNRGVARTKQGDLPGAIDDFAETIRLRPDLAKAYNNRGVARAKQGDLAGAIADFDEAIRLWPDYAEAYNDRGPARTKQGKLAGAFADFDEATQLRRDLAKAYNNRGLARTKQGDLAGAFADFDKAIRLWPDLAEAYNNRGVARTKQGDPAGARADLRRYLELVPDAPNRAEVEQVIAVPKAYRGCKNAPRDKSRGLVT